MHLHRKAHHLEPIRPQLLEIMQLLEMPIADPAPRAMALADQARIAAVGGALAAFGAGEVGTRTGSYLLAFMAGGLACPAASMLVPRIARVRPAVAAA